MSKIGRFPGDVKHNAPANIVIVLCIILPEAHVKQARRSINQVAHCVLGLCSTVVHSSIIASNMSTVQRQTTGFLPVFALLPKSYEYLQVSLTYTDS